MSAELPLARTTIDRAADLRTRPDLLASLMTDPATRVLLVHDGSVVTTELNGEPQVVLLPPGAAALLAPGGELSQGWLFLGYDDVDGLPGVAPDEPRPAGTPGYLARLVTDLDDAVLLPGHRWTPLRETGAVLSARDAGLATTAVALERWHVRSPRCPQCGAETRSEQGGWVRRCVADGTEHYPRTDPAVIMAVVDASDRLLLGHGAQWPENRFSTLAGFVEPGESLEHAVRREVREETAVVVGAVDYRGSQPWPFPGSLMIGFRAHALSTDIVVDGVEVTAARWFSRTELYASIRSGSVGLPGPTSIARALIEEWYGSDLPEAS